MAKQKTKENVCTILPGSALDVNFPAINCNYCPAKGRFSTPNSWQAFLFLTSSRL
ncbi:hypothetical protein [Desulfofundulus luciae]|uniref:hypothetical protein n=1 Tax=Desulfofundulus luciae TaxID=74702 RepID=UPI0027D8C319|nr:hypothetical protein [Desulfofundulus luciae]